MTDKSCRGRRLIVRKGVSEGHRFTEDRARHTSSLRCGASGTAEMDSAKYNNIMNTQIIAALFHKLQQETITFLDR